MKLASSARGKVLALWKHPLWVCFCILCFIVLMSRHAFVGDGPEYIAMTKALAEFHLPAFTQEDLNNFSAWARRQPFSGPKNIHLLFPALIGSDGRQELTHFWFYSLLNVPFWWLLSLLHLPTLYTFTLVNLSLLGLALWVASSTFKSPALILGLASPVLWYLNKAHTESFTFALALLGIALTLRERFLVAALVFAIAATQNVPWAVLALALGGVSLLQKFLLVQPQLAKNWNTAAKQVLGLICTHPLDAAVYCLILLLTLGLSILHPLYYLLRIGAPSPLLLMPYAGIRQGPFNLTAFFAILVDPDISLLVHWFPQSLLILGILFWLLWKGMRQLKLQFFTVRNLGILGFTAFIPVLMLSFSKTDNINHGATLGMSRYGIWLIPLLIPYLDYACRQRIFQSLPGRVGLNALCLAIFSAYLVTHSPSLPQNYRQPTRAARVFYQTLPCVYQPVPEIFVERNLGKEFVVKLPSAANSSCSLSYISAGVIPKQCTYSTEVQTQLNNYLAQGVSATWVLQPGRFKLCSERIIPLS